MVVELPSEKQISLFSQLKKLKRKVLSATPVKIRNLAKILGFLISCAFATSKTSKLWVIRMRASIKAGDKTKSFRYLF
jgi:hypothetical protein